MRIYLIATLLVALLAMSGIVSATDAVVGTTVDTAQEVTSAAPATIASVTPGTASYSDAATVVVNSNVNWDLGVSGTSGGKMINLTTPAVSALQVSATATPAYQGLTGTDANILSNQPYGADIGVPVTYGQTFGYADKAGLYAITVTWTIAPHV